VRREETRILSRTGGQVPTKEKEYIGRRNKIRKEGSEDVTTTKRNGKAQRLY